MSDTEEPSPEELEALADQEAQNSENDPEKEDEAMEEKGSIKDDGDGEDEDANEAEELNSEGEHSDTELMKASRLHAMRFLDNAAVDEDDVDELRQRLETDQEAQVQDRYEADSFCVGEDEVEYTSDHENTLQKRKKKRIRKEVSASDEEQEEEEQGAQTDADEQAKPEEVSEDDLENMKTLAGTSKKSQVQGAPVAKKGAFHDYPTGAPASKKTTAAAAVAASKKSAPASPSKKAKAKPMGSPKKEKPSIQQPPAKRQKIDTSYPVGETFQIGKSKPGAPAKVYIISHRGNDSPVTIGTNSKRVIDASIFHPDNQTTAELMQTSASGDGQWIGTDVFELFLTMKDAKPQKINFKYLKRAWEDYNQMSEEEKAEYATRAVRCNNFEVSDDQTTKRMMFAPELYEEIRKEAHKNGKGQLMWTPKHIRGDDHKFGQAPINITITGEVQKKPDSTKKTPSSPAKKQVKPKIERGPETKSRDVAQMLKSRPAAASASAMNPTALDSSSSGLNDSLDDLFGGSMSSASPSIFEDERTVKFVQSLACHYANARLKEKGATVQSVRDMHTKMLREMHDAIKAGKDIETQLKYLMSAHNMSSNGLMLLAKFAPILNSKIAQAVQGVFENKRS